MPAVDVVKGYAEALKFWGLSEVMGDDYGGGIVPSMFAKHGIRYQSCPLTASQLYLHCMPAWTSAMVRMCDVSRAVDQLVNLRRKVGQAGQESVVHLGNSHDDLANVVSGLIYRLTPLEPVAWDYDGIGVVSAQRDYDVNERGVRDLARVAADAKLWPRAGWRFGPRESTPRR